MKSSSPAVVTSISKESGAAMASMLLRKTVGSPSAPDAVAPPEPEVQGRALQVSVVNRVVSKGPAQSQPGSTAQPASQPSPGAVPPSSHASVASMTESPQTWASATDGRAQRASSEARKRNRRTATSWGDVVATPARSTVPRRVGPRRG